MKKETKKADVVIDATNGVLGRIASYAAKQALLGRNIAIVNCNNALLTGSRNSIIGEYYQARHRGGKSLNGPFFPKHPDRIMKRTVRGMLNYQQQRGLDAFKRIMCYNTVPAEYEGAKKITLIKELKSKAITVADLSNEI